MSDPLNEGEMYPIDYSKLNPEDALPEPPLVSIEVAQRQQILIEDGIDENEAKLLADLGYVKHGFPFVGPGGITLGPNVVANMDKTQILWEGVGVFILKRHDVDVQPAVRDYQVGEEVQVFQNRAWIEGTIVRSEDQRNRMVVKTRDGEEITVRVRNRIRRVL